MPGQLTKLSHHGVQSLRFCPTISQHSKKDQTIHINKNLIYLYFYDPLQVINFNSLNMQECHVIFLHWKIFLKNLFRCKLCWMNQLLQPVLILSIYTCDCVPSDSGNVGSTWLLAIWTCAWSFRFSLCAWTLCCCWFLMMLVLVFDLHFDLSIGHKLVIWIFILSEFVTLPLGQLNSVT
jgi:hypothetical protein